MTQRENDKNKSNLDLSERVSQIAESDMTEITPQEAFKSKKNFEEFMSNEHPAIILSTLADYPKADGKGIVTIAELTQNSETLINGLDAIKTFPQAPFFVWIVANERENLISASEVINKYADKNFGIFIFKASLNDEKITFKCLLKPDIKAKSTSGGKAKQIQLEYWEKYSEVCDELGEGNFQITPKPKHWQYISMGKAGVSLWLTVNTQIGFIGVDFLINDDKELFKKLQSNQKEIEKELGILDWENKPNLKASRIRKTVPFDINNKENLNTSIKAHIEMAKTFKTTFSKYL